jgi:Flp pilus assembly protein TadD/2-polyprenyl-3-methyl-5-hydroxy-6-metoxy-1,4-benzoquinol methylase
MKLTLDETLQKAVAFHEDGKIQDAERLYQAIVQSQPTHPDANHNLGVLAVSGNKAGAALSLFKTALKANPKKEQFWFSYIDALIKEKKYEAARQVIEQVKSKGMIAEKLTSFEMQLVATTEVSAPQKTPKKEEPNASPSSEDTELDNLIVLYKNKQFDEAEKVAVSLTERFPKHPFLWSMLSALFEQSGRYSEAVKASKTAVRLSPQDAQAHRNLGVTLKALKRLDEAEASFRQAIALKPDYAEAHNNLGNTLKALGRLDEAEPSYTKAIALTPKNVYFLNNFGLTLQELGRPDEAEARYRQAIALKPNYAEARNNLGYTLQKLGRLDEAEANYRQATALKPDYAEAHNNLGTALQHLGKFKEAYLAYIQAINLKPDLIEIKVNLSLVIKTLKFSSPDRQSYPILTDMLTMGNYTRPENVVGSILSLLKHDPLIKSLLSEKNILISLEETESAIKGLSKLTLLHHLMRLCPFPDLQLERFFVTMRSFFLMNLDEIKTSPELIYFLSSLSLHCFANEYIYYEGNKETRLVAQLEAEITQALAQAAQPELVKILCLACYRRLHQYDWCQKLEVLDHLEEIKTRLITEPYSEKIITKEIASLGEISNDVSLKVRAQYEENPYPRWVKLAIPTEAKSVAAICESIKLQLNSEIVKDVAAPTILIAGCGTGQHSIETASRFSNCHVTAVDLSLASLAFAQRKTNELHINNLKYLQADILDLHQLNKKFDIIESVGVLHHMNNPMAGWAALTKLLKPNGLMRIGLYSELARSHIVKTRHEIALSKVGVSELEIRNFRRCLIESSEEHHRKLLKTSDFFNLSTLRDLIFHVQEHYFTIPKIESYLNELGLKFCGFENKDIVSRFRVLHNEDQEICDLALWHKFEKSNPDSFDGMYQFWCQKL